MTKGPKNPTPHTLGLIGALILQFLLGMFTALFVTFPEGASEKQVWKFAGQNIPIVFHMLLGILILLGAIALVVRAIIMKDKNWIWTSIIGLFGVLVADVTGLLFVSQQNDMYSYTMAVAFIVALVSYFWGIYKAR